MKRRGEIRFRKQKREGGLTYKALIIRWGFDPILNTLISMISPNAFIKVRSHRLIPFSRQPCSCLHTADLSRSHGARYFSMRLKMDRCFSSWCLWLSWSSLAARSSTSVFF